MYEFKIPVSQWHLDNIKPKDFSEYHTRVVDGPAYCEFPNFFIDIIKCHITAFVSTLGAKVVKSYYPSDYYYGKSWFRFEVKTKKWNGQYDMLAYQISVDQDYENYFKILAAQGPSAMEPKTFTVNFTETKPFIPYYN